MFGIEEAFKRLEAAAKRVDADALDGDRALRLVGMLAKAERVLAAARSVVIRRVEETQAWKRTGHRSMAEWLAATNGTTVGQAIGSIDTARALEDLPATEAAFRAGDLSEAQAREVTAGAIENPRAERSLLDTARAETVRTLRQRSRAVIAAATAEDEERERDAKVHRERYLRRWLDGDGAAVRLAGSGFAGAPPRHRPRPGRALSASYEASPSGPVSALRAKAARRRPVDPAPGPSVHAATSAGGRMRRRRRRGGAASTDAGSAGTYSRTFPHRACDRVAIGGGGDPSGHLPGLAVLFRSHSNGRSWPAIRCV